MAGADTTVITLKMFQLYVPQLNWLEAHVHRRDVLKCITMAHGELCVMIILIMQQQELCVIGLDMDIMGKLLVTAMVPAEDRSGWTFSAVEWKQTLQTVDTVAGADTTVLIIKMFLYHALMR